MSDSMRDQSSTDTPNGVCSAPPNGFNIQAARRLGDLDAQGHFWLQHRTRLIRHLLRRRQLKNGGPWKQALELGCGTGQSLRDLESLAVHVTAVDGHPTLLEAAKQRTSKTNLHHRDVTSTGLPTGQYDLICAFDVLEHVNPDDFLGEARRLATNDADLLISVPAGQYLWSQMDEAAGHRCRYDAQMLRSEMNRNEWLPGWHTHYQFLLLPLLYASRRWASSNNHVKRERLPSPLVAGTLSLINRLEVGGFNAVPLPWGSSLFMWARARGSRP